MRARGRPPAAWTRARGHVRFSRDDVGGEFGEEGQAIFVGEFGEEVGMYKIEGDFREAGGEEGGAVGPAEVEGYGVGLTPGIVNDNQHAPKANRPRGPTRPRVSRSGSLLSSSGERPSAVPQVPNRASKLG